jgi:hypothetical protein
MSDSATAKYGLFMVGGIGGAIIFLLLKNLPGFIGIIAGLLLLLLGIGALSSKKAEDRFPGILCIAVGFLAVLAQMSFFKGFAGRILEICAIALLVLGIFNGIRFALGLRNRSQNDEQIEP